MRRLTACESCRSNRIERARQLKELQQKLLQEATQLALEVETPEEQAELDRIFSTPPPGESFGLHRQRLSQMLSFR